MFKKILFSLVLISSLFFSFNLVLAAGTSAPNPSADVVTLDNPLNVETPQALIGLIINTVLGIIGSVALVMFIYGGIIWMTSGGNEKKVSQGKDILMWAAIGLVVIFTSYALVKFVIFDIIQAK